MGRETWSPPAKICDVCKAAPSAVFCRADSAFLCVACDGDIHAANKLASRHARVWVCEVCEQAPAAVTCKADAATCKADAATLCAACDSDIHSANPLARRHERVPVAHFFDAAAMSGQSADEEAAAASWLLLPIVNDEEGQDEESGSPEYKSAERIFNDTDPYLDLDLLSGDQKPHQPAENEQVNLYTADGVVPVQSKTEFWPGYYPEPIADGFPTYEMDYGGPKPFLYNFTVQSLSQSVSSSSLEVGVVPDHVAMADVSDSFGKSESVPVPVSGVDREARVLRYRQKRKNRKFEKTIRYASRKAYAETRPRIKGRFVKRSELEADYLVDSSSYSVVPTR